MIAYKIVQETGDDNVFISPMVSHYCPKLAVQYVPNKPTYAPSFNPLMAFRDFRSAYSFREGAFYYAYNRPIWKCEVIPVEYGQVLNLAELRECQDEIDLNGSVESWMHKVDPIVGTIFCDRITLIERMK